MKKILASLLLPTILFISCGDEKTEGVTPETNNTATTISPPNFNADSAYACIVKQVSFGPRVPGSAAQQKCANYLIAEMKKCSDTVFVQKANVLQPVSNKKYPCINIIGSINPSATNRILLLAHWDSRAWADEDTKDKLKPIDAADDGGSGVAVLLEIAKQMKANRPKDLGVDFLLVDVEDMGKTEWSGESYCLGTQYWAKNPHIAGYKAQFGICLDMVGAKNARFPLEAYSATHASSVQQKIWNAASRIGYSGYFVNENGDSIEDDHVPINEIINIPCVDIINLKYPHGFGDHWHTHADNLSVIDKNTLKAVGQTVMQVIYENQ
jgi:glutaminyl-peptide cyclotransferase